MTHKKLDKSFKVMKNCHQDFIEATQKHFDFNGVQLLHESLKFISYDLLVKIMTYNLILKKLSV